MLEVLNQDYIRTARAKGLTERTVIMRHGFRNAMIPLATIVAFDIGGILGGAVITETVFEWNAMGRMFSDGLQNRRPQPGDGVLRRGRRLRRDLQPHRRPAVRRARPAHPDHGLRRTMTLIQDPTTRRTSPARCPSTLDDEQRSSRRRSPASARGRSSAAGSSGTRARWSR